MRLLERLERIIAKHKNGRNMPKLEMINVVLMHCNVFNNINDQQI